MGKRNADTELNADNWDRPDTQPDEEEAFGEHEKASEEVISKRKIAKPRRNKFQAANKSNLFGEKKENPFASFKAVEQKKSEPSGHSNITPSTSQNMDDASKDEKFQLATVKLNKQFLEQVTGFFEKNNCVNFEPCFASYIQHFDRNVKHYGTPAVVDMIERQRSLQKLKIEGKNVPKKEEEKLPLFQPKTDPETTENVIEEAEPKKPTFNFSKTAIEKENSAKPFQFNMTTSAAKPVFDFSKAVKKDESKPPSFGSTDKKESPEKPKFTGFNFSSAPKVPLQETSQDEVTEAATEGEPSDLIPERQEVKFESEGVIFEQRCKLYYKKESGFKERGVGTLYIKKSEDGKGQIIIRAENSVGTILLNCALSKGLPVSKSGKNNVMLVCNVFPDIPGESFKDDETNPFLIKVKSPDAADSIYKNIKEFV